MREIKFELIGKNMSGKILKEVYTLEELMDSSWEESYSVEVIAKRQWTGLKDRTGREIYEGDLLKISEDLVLPIIFDAALGSFRCDGSGDHMYGANYCEVIGNIYENGELLEKHSGRDL